MATLTFGGMPGGGTNNPSQSFIVMFIQFKSTDVFTKFSVSLKGLGLSAPDSVELVNNSSPPLIEVSGGKIFFTLAQPAGPIPGDPNPNSNTANGMYQLILHYDDVVRIVS